MPSCADAQEFGPLGGTPNPPQELFVEPSVTLPNNWVGNTGDLVKG